MFLKVYSTPQWPLSWPHLLKMLTPAWKSSLSLCVFRSRSTDFLGTVRKMNHQIWHLNLLTRGAALFYQKPPTLKIIWPHWKLERLLSSLNLTESACLRRYCHPGKQMVGKWEQYRLLTDKISWLLLKPWYRAGATCGCQETSILRLSCNLRPQKVLSLCSLTDLLG